MLHRLNELWEELKVAPPGERFQRLYMTHAHHDSGLVKELLLMAALGCFTIGLVFMFATGGPAMLFLVLALALVATQSGWLARNADSVELLVRGMGEKLRGEREYDVHDVYDDDIAVLRRRTARLSGVHTASRISRV